MDELLAQFLVEGPELVQQGSDALLELERDAFDREALNNAFRAIHTLKGSVGLFDYPAMASVLHAAEDILHAVRDNRRTVDAALIDSLIAVMTQIDRWFTALNGKGRLPDDSDAAARVLIGRLDQFTVPIGGVIQGSHYLVQGSDATAHTAAPDWQQDLLSAAQAEGCVDGAAFTIHYVARHDSYYAGSDPVKIISAVPGLLFLRFGLQPDPSGGGLYDPYTCRLIVQGVSSGSEREVRQALRLVADQVALMAVSDRMSATQAVRSERARSATSAEGTVRSLRVDVEKIDGLAALVDQLVTVKNSFSLGGDAQEASSGRHGRSSSHELLDRLVGQLHRNVASLRMIPVNPLLRRFHRSARDMAANLGKDIDLLIEEASVEADKSIVEALFEPLNHLLRNAVDHGIELPEERKRAGKAEKGVITITARQVGSRLQISLSDDGRGIDPRQIRTRAGQRSLMDADSLSRLSDDAALQLIFLPGFSTAPRVTELSGRGVGMDAVRSSVIGLGGELTIDSTVGKGTTVNITLPLRMTLTKLLVVEEGGESYGVPLDRIRETVRLRADQVSQIRSGNAIDWRDRTIPLVRIGSFTKMESSAARAITFPQIALVVALNSGIMALAIDAIRTRLDVSMRMPEGLLKNMHGLAGTTMMGNGELLVVLDLEVFGQ